MKKVSVVVISRNEGSNLRDTVQNLDQTLPAATEIVVVDDGSTDGSADTVPVQQGRIRVMRESGLGVTRARNLGARNTNGDILVFADAHLELRTAWWVPLVDALADSRIGAITPVITDTRGGSFAGCGLTFRGPDMEIRWLTPPASGSVPVPIVPGCCLAMRRDVFEAAGGWDVGLLHRGNVDNELSIRLWLLGYELHATAEVAVGHLFRLRSPYRTGWAEYLHNRIRLAHVHLNPERIARVESAFAGHAFLPEAMRLIEQGDTSARRSDMLTRRTRDDEWYFDRFALDW